MTIRILYLKNTKIYCLKRVLTLFLFTLFFTIPEYSYARTIGIAVLESEKPQEADAFIPKLFKQELQALFEGEHVIKFTKFSVSETSIAKDIYALMDKAYRNSHVDYVLVLDVPMNQVAGLYSSYKKPTFLPVVLNSTLLSYPKKGEGSGKKNLFYFTRNFDFDKELQVLKTVTPFKKIALIVDPKMRKNLSQSAQEQLVNQAKDADVSLQIISFEAGNYQRALAAIPTDADAVLYGAFPTTSSIAITSLIQGVNTKGLPSFSLSGEQYVRLGALATNSPDTDWQRLARHTALQIQEVELGAAPETLPVAFETTNQLMINMATSRQIRIAPSFDVLSDAILLHEDDVKPTRNYSLTEVARKAVEVNLALAAQRLQAERAGERVNEARGALLPRLDASVGYNTRKNSVATRNGTLAEDSTDGSITLTQPLFKEEFWAAHTIQKFNALSEKQLLEQTELDIIQSAVTIYLNILRAQTSLKQERYNLSITRENYRLAKVRVEVGDSNKSDLYRWESELANAKQAVLAAKSSLERQRQDLNRVLNRPINEIFSTSIETLDNPDFVISDPRITELITNRYALEALTEWFVETGLERSPEIKQLEATIAANKRQLESDGRAYWLPDANLTATYTNNIDETRNGGISAEDDDWTVGVTLSLPLYEGGARSARKAQSNLAMRQSETLLNDTKNSVETTIRNAVASVNSSFPSIELAKLSEKASQKNYDLVADSYAQGQVSIVNLLDAQEALILAREASMNANYTLLIDLMNVQRSIGAFDFFLTDTERVEFSDHIIQRVSQKPVVKTDEDVSQ